MNTDSRMSRPQKVCLKVGKTYRNCAGHEIKIVSAGTTDPIWGTLFRDSDGVAYYQNGEYFNCERTSWDLVSMVEEAKNDS